MVNILLIDQEPLFQQAFSKIRKRKIVSLSELRKIVKKHLKS